MAETIDNIFGVHLQNLILAIIIILIGFIIGRILGKLITKILHEIELNNIIKKLTGIKLSLEELAGQIIAFISYFASIILALSQVGLASTIGIIISAFIIVLVIISFLLGVKDFFPNFIAGLALHRKNLFKEGSRIKTKDIEGKIIKAALTETVIETKNKDIIYIPNSLLRKSIIRIGK